MQKNNENILRFLLLLFVLLIFILNVNHINQQGTYNNIFIEIAKNLLAGKGYTCNELGNSPLFYPLWGYTFLLIPDIAMKSGDIFIYVVQYILTVSTILLFLRIFALKLKLIYFFLLIPYIALMSVKWPDAIVGSLIIFTIYFVKKYLNSDKIIFAILSGSFYGILINFRSEYIYLPLLLLVVSAFPKINIHRKKVLITSFMFILAGIILIFPWSYRAYQITGDVRLSASNGGAVMYISLGQLPNNEWAIVPIDETVYNLADSLGFDSPYSHPADDYFKSLTLKNVQNNPLEYMKKTGYNLFSSITRGVYTGEYANSFIGIEHRYKIEKSFSEKKNTLAKMDYLIKADKFVTIPIIFEKLLQGIFVVIFLIIIFASILKTVTGKLKFDTTFIAIILAFIVYKFIIVSAIQYEYRHMNAVYLLILGIALYKKK